MVEKTDETQKKTKLYGKERNRLLGKRDENTEFIPV